MKSAKVLTTLAASIGCSFALEQTFDHTQVLDKVAPVMKKKEAESATENDYVHPRVNVHANSKRHRYDETIKHTLVPQVIDVFEDGLFWGRMLQSPVIFSQQVAADLIESETYAVPTTMNPSPLQSKSKKSTKGGTASFGYDERTASTTVRFPSSGSKSNKRNKTGSTAPVTSPTISGIKSKMSKSNVGRSSPNPPLSGSKSNKSQVGVIVPTVSPTKAVKQALLFL